MRDVVLHVFRKLPTAVTANEDSQASLTRHQMQDLNPAAKPGQAVLSGSRLFVCSCDSGKSFLHTVGLGWLHITQVRLSKFDYDQSQESNSNIDYLHTEWFTSVHFHRYGLQLMLT